MLKKKVLLFVTMLVCAFGLFTGCGGDNPGSSPDDKMDELRREGVEFNFTISMGGDMSSLLTGSDPSDPQEAAAAAFVSALMGSAMNQSGTFGAKGDLMWTEMTTPDMPSLGISSMSVKEVMKLKNNGKKADVYYYSDGVYQGKEEIDYDEYMEDPDNQEVSITTDMVTSEVDFSNFTKQGTKTYAGKTCDYYVGKGEYAGTEIAYYAEKGITLYCKTVSEGMTIEMTITSIKFGSEVTAPALPE